MRAALLPKKEQHDDGGPDGQLSWAVPTHRQPIQGDSGKVSEVPMVYQAAKALGEQSTNTGSQKISFFY